MTDSDRATRIKKLLEKMEAVILAQKQELIQLEAMAEAFREELRNGDVHDIRPLTES